MSATFTPNTRKQLTKALQAMSNPKTYDAGKVGRVTIPEPDETDNPEYVRADIARAIEAQRDALLEACKAALPYVESVSDDEAAEKDVKAIRAAIKQAEGRVK